jgi:hypothetical protein
MGKTLLRGLSDHSGKHVPYSPHEGELTESDLEVESAEVKGSALAMLATPQPAADPDREVWRRCTAVLHLRCCCCCCWLFGCLPACAACVAPPPILPPTHKHPPARLLHCPCPCCPAGLCSLGVWRAHRPADVLG